MSVDFRCGKYRGLHGVCFYVWGYDTDEEWTVEQASKVAKAMKDLDLSGHDDLTPMLEEIRKCFMYAKRHRGTVVMC